MYDELYPFMSEQSKNDFDTFITRLTYSVPSSDSVFRAPIEHAFRRALLTNGWVRFGVVHPLGHAPELLYCHKTMVRQYANHLYNLACGTDAPLQDHIPESGVIASPVPSALRKQLLADGWRCVGLVKPYKLPGKILYTNLEGLSNIALYNLALGSN